MTVSIKATVTNLVPASEKPFPKLMRLKEGHEPIGAIALIFSSDGDGIGISGFEINFMARYFSLDLFEDFAWSVTLQNE